MNWKEDKTASRYGGGVFVVDTRESMVRGRDTSIRESRRTRPEWARPCEARGQGRAAEELPTERATLGHEIAQEADIAKMAKL